MSVQFVKSKASAIFAIDCADDEPYKVPAKPVSLEYLRGPGSLRTQHLMYLYGRSKSAINRKVKEGRIPPPTGYDPRPWWSNAVIRQHLGISDSAGAVAKPGVAYSTA